MCDNYNGTTNPPLGPTPPRGFLVLLPASGRLLPGLGSWAKAPGCNLAPVRRIGVLGVDLVS